MTTVDMVFPGLGVAKGKVALCGVLAGIIGLYQNTTTVMEHKGEKGDS